MRRNVEQGWSMGSSLLGRFFLLSGLFFLVWAVGFTARLPAMTGLWMWPDTRLSFIFIGSICAALATGSLWVAWSGRWQAARHSLAGLTLVYATGAIYLWVLYAGGTQPGILGHTIGYSVSAVVGAIALAIVSGEPGDGGRLMPLVKWSCAVFAVALLLAGAGLVARYETIFPWPLSPQSSTLFGLTFIGLSVIYASTWLRGGWGAGMVAMSGFLVYDLVLLPPFLMHFGTVAPERLFSLVLYVIVLIYSAAVAIYFLLTDGRKGTAAT